MDSFLQKVIDDIKLNQTSFSQVFVLPNKRSCLYFKRLLLSSTKKTTFAPDIISIDEFIIKMSGLKELNETNLVLNLYKEYSKIKKIKKKDSYSEFYLWSKTFIKDMSEVEQNLINPQIILKELIEINKINIWGNKDQFSSKTSLSFWSMLPQLYENFKVTLSKKNEGTKGICYAEAKNNLELYKKANKNLNHFFIGLNALTKTETIIIKELLEHNKGEIYWDIDNEFMKNKIHGSSTFMRKYRNNWNRFKKSPFKWVQKDYRKKKTIKIIGTPKFIGQSNVIATILSSSYFVNNGRTAVVLGEEALIKPLLNVNPIKSKDLEITIKIDLNITEIKKILEVFFEAQSNETKDTEVLLNSFFKFNLIKRSFNEPSKLNKKDLEIFNRIFVKHNSYLEILNTLLVFFNKMRTINKEVSNQFVSLDEFVKSLQDLKSTFNKLSLNYELNLIKSIVINGLNKLRTNFEPNFDSKIKIMGLLESRCLDFQNVIVSSLNEGILPKGKIHSTLIPYDLRKKHKLLTHDEKDSIYTYHFYRLIKRSKNIYLIYNNHNEGIFGGEKSRFIHQIEQDHRFNIIYLQSNPNLSIENKLFGITNSKSSLNKLKMIAKRGFSPSFLEQYIKDPREFYFKKLLEINENDLNEINSRLIGVVIHETLELLYRPLINKKINKKQLLNVLSKIDITIKKIFLKNGFKNLLLGKLMVAYEVVKKSLTNFIEMEINDIRLGNEIRIVAIEKKMEISLKIPELKLPIKLKGVIDRVDTRNGVLRIIDYKTGLIRDNEVIVGEIAKSLVPSKTKAVQLMCYALMYLKNHKKNKELEAGIFSFRNIKKGFLKLGFKDAPNKMNFIVTNNKLADFEKVLKKLILEIMDSKTIF
ncbi:MAG: PD-(D/E)XK nuclease family protein [Flavobacteriaceae bacterium]